VQNNSSKAYIVINRRTAVLLRAGLYCETERKKRMAWKLDSDRPIYAQILEIIQMQIISGKYQPGDKIPSVRELAADAGVNPNTMQKALSELERSGLILTQRTSGRTVTDDMELIQKMRDEIARGQVQEFINKMKDMGFDKKEILQILKESES